VNLSLSPEQEELRKTARQFLAHAASSHEVRRQIEASEPYDAALWKRIAELGWLSVVIPVEYGGAGMTTFDLTVLMEEMGRTLVPIPYFSTVCLAAQAIMLGGDAAQKAAYLPSIAAGTTVGTLAICEQRAGWDGIGLETRAQETADGWRLDGAKLFVPDGLAADLFIVAAHSHAGPTLFLLDAAAAGINRRPHVTLDLTRRLAEITLDGVSVAHASILGQPGAAVELLAQVVQRAAIALAAEQLGGAQRVLEMSVAYAKERVQFERPIGSFQAVKHLCANMLLEVEAARSAAYLAAATADEEPEQLPAAANVAKAYCSEAYFHAAATNIQVHGGNGFTWEHDAHLYFKRAASSSILLGSPEQHRERLAELIGL
jgi:alkylation response protein AidB-like acyl-CoA dehydrogenase